ncbi:hypothetical protein B0H19DRAFT_1098597 [Mycena capillaripes]|nr:hypothetical protein B0H19DRAFT_1098597 [Mycena capillaripes]
MAEGCSSKASSSRGRRVRTWDTSRSSSSKVNGAGCKALSRMFWFSTSYIFTDFGKLLILFYKCNTISPASKHTYLSATVYYTVHPSKYTGNI